MAIRNPLVPADRWLLLAAAFVLGNLALLAITAPPALRWQPVVMALAWAAAALSLRQAVQRHTPAAPPRLPALALTLSGWGLMGIWRVMPAYGVRQAFALVLAAWAATLLLARPRLLPWLRRNAFPLLLGGLALLAPTVVVGRHPAGAGPRLWLGCCGAYFQPAALFKVLLVIALAAEGRRWRPGLAAATLTAAALLAAQQDFGTAVFLTALYAAAEACLWQRRLPLALTAAAALPAGGWALHTLPVARQRLEAWLTPSRSPQRYGYQILQAEHALHVGGIFGLGLKPPTAVPLAHSDFIFVAIANGWGLFGALVLMAMLAALPLLALHLAGPRHTFPQRLTAAAGLYLGGQTLVVLGGNLRLLPLTGMPLPFVASGGSALLAVFLTLGVLLQANGRASSLPSPKNAARWCFRLFLAAFTLAALATGWWMLP